MIKKPPYGSPCNSCGKCCEDSACPLSHLVLNAAYNEPCPALETEGEKKVCGLINNPKNYVPVLVAIHGTKALSKGAVILTGAGIGCDCCLYSSGEEMPKNVEQLQRAMRAKLPSTLVVDQAKKVWGVS